MAILTVSEQADMLNRLANEVVAGGHVVTLYPAYAQALLNVLAALEAVTAERDALFAKTERSYSDGVLDADAAIPYAAIKKVYSMMLSFAPIEQLRKEKAMVDVVAKMLWAHEGEES